MEEGGRWEGQNFQQLKKVQRLEEEGEEEEEEEEEEEGEEESYILTNTLLYTIIY